MPRSATSPSIVWHRGGPLALGLPIAGGLVYTLGATGFERQWPTHRPATFPHHNVWHAFTIADVGLHFAAIYTRDVTIDPAAPFTDNEAP